jgi:hypothetical protein
MIIGYRFWVANGFFSSGYAKRTQYLLLFLVAGVCSKSWTTARWFEMKKSYSWQQSYQDALLELNPAELRAKLSRAVSELEKRRLELMVAQDKESLAERQAITDALNGLGAISRFELTVPCEPGCPPQSSIA